MMTIQPLFPLTWPSMRKLFSSLILDLILQALFVPRMGELHVVMASLRALDTSVENSGIDDAWIEADVYDSATTESAMQTLQALSPCPHIYICSTL